MICQNYATCKRKATNFCWPDDLRPVSLYWNDDRRSTATRLPKLVLMLLFEENEHDHVDALGRWAGTERQRNNTETSARPPCTSQEPRRKNARPLWWMGLALPSTAGPKDPRPAPSVSRKSEQCLLYIGSVPVFSFAGGRQDYARSRAPKNAITKSSCLTGSFLSYCEAGPMNAQNPRLN